MDTANTPRADISKDIPPILKQLEDANWLVRKSGLESLQALLAQHQNRISLNGLHDLVAALKGKMNESNKGLARSFI